MTQPGVPAAAAAVALCLAAIALASGARSAGPRARVARVAALTRHAPRPGGAASLSQPRLARLVAALAGLAAALIVGGWAGAALGLLLGAALDRGLRRLEPGAVRAERAAAAAALPFAADLLGAVLRSGAPTARAVAQVADAVRGPLGRQLSHVARGLELGAPAAEAWRALGTVPAAAPLIRAAVRANDSGAALAGACARLAAELRAGRDAEAEAAARRAGVLVVLPLGCCFLPAFVLIGVVPIVLGVLDGVLG